MLCICVVLIGSLAFVNKQKNNFKEENSKIKNKLESLEKDSSNKEIKKPNDLDSDDTFEEDAKWVAKEIYGKTNRKEVYEDVKDSLTKKVVTQLFGEKPEERFSDYEDQENSNVVTRTIQNQNFYGKYINENKYSIILTLDLDVKAIEVTEKKFVVLEMNFEKQKNGQWLVSKFEEIAMTNR